MENITIARGMHKIYRNKKMENVGWCDLGQEIIKKTCRKCEEIKSIENFYWRKDINKYRSECKSCIRKYEKNNKEKRRENHRRYRKNNKEKIKLRNKKYQKNYSEKLREYRKKNKEKRMKYQKIWKKNNPNYCIEWNKNKKRKNPMFKLSTSISISIYLSLKGNKNGRHWEDLVGYILKDLIIHLENLFKSGMTWDNMSKWHIDHIIPISLWEFTEPTDREFKQCWALANLQPLWAIENMSKGVKIIWDRQ